MSRNPRPIRLSSVDDRKLASDVDILLRLAELREEWASGLLDRQEFRRAQDALAEAVRLKEEAHGAENYRVLDVRLKLTQAKLLEGLSVEQRQQLKEAERLTAGLDELRRRDLAQAQQAAEKSLAIRRAILGERHRETADSLLWLGGIQSDQDQDAKSLDASERALATRRVVLGEKHPDTASAYSSVGIGNSNLGRALAKPDYFAKAREYLEKALAIRRDVCGQRSAETAETLNNLGQMYRSLGGYGPAEDYLREALAIRQEVLGDDAAATAETMHCLGALLHDLGRAMRDSGQLTEARRYLEEAVTKLETLRGDRDPHVAIANGELANVLERQGDLQSARQRYERAITMLGDEARESEANAGWRVWMLHGLSDVLAAQQDAAGARRQAGFGSGQTGGVERLRHGPRTGRRGRGDPGTAAGLPAGGSAERDLQSVEG